MLVFYAIAGKSSREGGDMDEVKKLRLTETVSGSG